MATVDVVTGADILATEYNLLRSEVIANVSGIADATAAASGAAADVVTHAAVTAQIHGLASGIDVLGAQTAGLHIQYATGASTWSHAGGQWETRHAYAAWPVAFTNIYAVAVSFGVGSHTAESAYGGEVRDMAYTTTGATQVWRIYNAQGENTSMWANFIGIGN